MNSALSPQKANVPNADKKFFQSLGDNEEAAVVSGITGIRFSHDVM